jgi:hypothetical protein
LLTAFVDFRNRLKGKDRAHGRRSRSDELLLAKGGRGVGNRIGLRRDPLLGILDALSKSTGYMAAEFVYARFAIFNA